MTTDSEHQEFKKTVAASVLAIGSVQRQRRLLAQEFQSVSQDVPRSLKWALWAIVVALLCITAAAIVILFFAGFSVGGFSLEASVLIALVSGLSLQFIASALFPLIGGISSVLIEREKRARGA